LHDLEDALSRLLFHDWGVNNELKPQSASANIPQLGRTPYNGMDQRVYWHNAENK
jgi:hypothetical protein